MARRCQSCNMFCSVEPECDYTDDVEVDDGTVSVSATVVLTSACCGEAVAEASVEGEEFFEFEHTRPDDADEDWECDGSLDVSEDGIEVNDRYEIVNPRTGKRIPARYQRHFYGFEALVTVTCSNCKAEAQITVKGEEAASAFEEV